MSKHPSQSDGHPSTLRGTAGEFFDRLIQRVQVLANVGVARTNPASDERSDRPRNPGGAHSDLDELSNLIVSKYRFDSAAYPSINEHNAAEAFQFALRHIALHYSKSTGQLATACESADHGGEIDLAYVRAVVPKLLINTLRLSSLVGLSGEDLVDAIEKRYTQKSDQKSINDREGARSLAA